MNSVKDALGDSIFLQAKEFNVKFRATRGGCGGPTRRQELLEAEWWALIEQVRVRGSIHFIHE